MERYSGGIWGPSSRAESGRYGRFGPRLDPTWTRGTPLPRFGSTLRFRMSMFYLGVWFGGPGEIRTHDLFHAMEARSQLRHRPTRIPIQTISQEDERTRIR